MIVLTEENQTTIKKDISLRGVGLHTVKEVNLTFKPAKENTGYTFTRIDLKEKPVIEANINYVFNTDRGTCLNKDDVRIQTTEHVLAALVGLEIDNVSIELDASEPPIMDGSSKFFVEALEMAGKKDLEEKRKEFVVRDIITYKDLNSGSEITVIPSSEYQITTIVDFGTKIGQKKTSAQVVQHYSPNSIIGKQVAAVVNFPPKQIGKFMSEVLVVGFPDENGEVVLIEPGQKVPNGGRLY